MTDDDDDINLKLDVSDEESGHYTFEDIFTCFLYLENIN